MEKLQLKKKKRKISDIEERTKKYWSNVLNRGEDIGSHVQGKYLC